MSQGNADMVRDCFDAIATGVSPEELSAFFTPDVIKEEIPKGLLTHGARRDLNQILKASKHGKRVMQPQRFEILHAISGGDEIALEVQ